MPTQTYEELIAERDAIQRKVDKAFARERELAFAKIRELMQQYSIRVVDLTQRTRFKLSKPKIKYRDPADPGNTWTGRGRPAWLDAGPRPRRIPDRSGGRGYPQQRVAQPSIAHPWHGGPAGREGFPVSSRCGIGCSQAYFRWAGGHNGGHND
jgi:DNA-binding protein H-NS